MPEKFQRKNIPIPVLPKGVSPPLQPDFTFCSLHFLSSAQLQPSVLWQWTVHGLESSENPLGPLSFILSWRLSGRPPRAEYMEGAKGLLRRTWEIVRHKRKTPGKNHPRSLLNEACHHFQRTKRALFHLLQCLQFDFFFTCCILGCWSRLLKERGGATVQQPLMWKWVIFWFSLVMWHSLLTPSSNPWHSLITLPTPASQWPLTTSISSRSQAS